MKHRPTSKRRRTTRSVLRLLDLEHAKAAVLYSLTSPDAQRGYRHAIDEFESAPMTARGRRAAGHAVFVPQFGSLPTFPDAWHHI
jgi:hypothetical protein